jgi:hypothetical protein
MDKSVKRVTVVEGSGENRHSKIVYEGQPLVDEAAMPPIERAVRHVVNAALITAQVAYDSYVKRAAEGKTDWVFQPRGSGTQAGTEASHAADEDRGKTYGQSGTRID